MGGYGGLFATPYLLFLKSVLLPSYISVKKFGLFGALKLANANVRLVPYFSAWYANYRAKSFVGCVVPNGGGILGLFRYSFSDDSSTISRTQFLLNKSHCIVCRNLKFVKTRRLNVCFMRVCIFVEYSIDHNLLAKSILTYDLYWLTNDLALSIPIKITSKYIEIYLVNDCSVK